MYDLVVKNGLVVDGTGCKPHKADIGIKAGEIAFIGEIDEDSKKIIEAEGLVVSPGFIDVHSHCDLVHFTDHPYKYARVKQGITTDLIGQCGLGPVPYLPEMKPWKEYLQPILGETGANQWHWPRVKDFLQDLGQEEKAYNVATLVTHGAVRAQVIGLEDRQPTPAEIEKMQAIVEKAMQDGVYGISYGLAYLPGVFAPKEELIALSQVVAKYDGLMMIHIRNHSRKVREALAEALEVAAESGVKLQISHMRSYANRDFGISSEELIKIVEEARAKNIDVTFDQHPYEAGSTLLSQVLPPWAKEGGGAAIVKRMRNQEALAQLKIDLGPQGMDYPGWDNFVGMVGWENILVSSVSKAENKVYQGKTMNAIAEEMNLDVVDALARLLISEEAQCCMVMLNLFSEADIVELLAHPLNQVGSDGIPTGEPHPRLFGTFPKFLGHYVRDKKILSLEEAISHITSYPAERLGIMDRGRIAAGLKADLVIFDYNEINAPEDYLDPVKEPVGIKYVLVNGEIAVQAQEMITTTAGTVLVKQ